jgi:hypothetical protein
MLAREATRSRPGNCARRSTLPLSDSPGPIVISLPIGSSIAVVRSSGRSGPNGSLAGTAATTIEYLEPHGKKQSIIRTGAVDRLTTSMSSEWRAAAYVAVTSREGGASAPASPGAERNTATHQTVVTLTKVDISVFLSRGVSSGSVQRPACRKRASFPRPLAAALSRGAHSKNRKRPFVLAESRAPGRARDPHPFVGWPLLTYSAKHHPFAARRRHTPEDTSYRSRRRLSTEFASWECPSKGWRHWPQWTRFTGTFEFRPTDSRRPYASYV